MTVAAVAAGLTGQSNGQGVDRHVVKLRILTDYDRDREGRFRRAAGRDEIFRRGKKRAADRSATIDA